jgi:glycosyltransferase involved in cell wall biosynthesis
MITYKHEAFIAQAIEGVLMQEVKFPVELIIADDCSPDKTKHIIESFKKHKNYNWIKYTRHQTNKGMMANFMWALQQSKGKYIALCEGDDYWTDPYKLQKQVDFLESNEYCVLCFHDVNILMGDGELKDDFITRLPITKLLDQRSLIENNNFIHTPSVMFRNLGSQVPQEILFSPVGDFLIYLWLTNYGAIGYINEKMSIYRFGTGLHSKKMQEKRNKEFYWVLLIGSFLIKNLNNKALIENKLINFLKLFSSWDELVYDYNFTEGVKKHIDICKKNYDESQQFNIRKMSVTFILTYLLNRICKRFKAFR